MKKIILFTGLMLTLSVFAQDAQDTDVIEEPKWRDFAPVAYVDVKEPKGLAKFNDVAAYWYKRRIAFENDLEKCRAIEKAEDKISCYQDIKVKQYQKNSDYNARLEAIERSKMYPQEMQDPTTNMYPIGGFLDNMTRFQPNELH